MLLAFAIIVVGFAAILIVSLFLADGTTPRKRLKALRNMLIFIALGVLSVWALLHYRMGFVWGIMGLFVALLVYVQFRGKKPPN